MSQENAHYIRPCLLIRILNRFYGSLARIGLVPHYSYLLQVKGRKTGKTRSMPVNVICCDGRNFLVAGRGHTQWSRNVLVDNAVTLTKGRVRMEFRLRVVPNVEKPAILKAYLVRFNWWVWRFFPVQAGSPSVAFEPIAGDYPVFELVRYSG